MVKRNIFSINLIYSSIIIRSERLLAKQANTFFLTFMHHKVSLFCPVRLTAGPHPNTSLKTNSTLCPFTPTSLCLHNTELKFSYSFLSCHSCYITRPSHPPWSCHSNTTCLLHDFILPLFSPSFIPIFFSTSGH